MFIILAPDDQDALAVWCNCLVRLFHVLHGEIAQRAECGVEQSTVVLDLPANFFLDILQ